MAHPNEALFEEFAEAIRVWEEQTGRRAFNPFKILKSGPENSIEEIEEKYKALKEKIPDRSDFSRKEKLVLLKDAQEAFEQLSSVEKIRNRISELEKDKSTQFDPLITKDADELGKARNWFRIETGISLNAAVETIRDLKKIKNIPSAIRNNIRNLAIRLPRQHSIETLPTLWSRRASTMGFLLGALGGGFYAGTGFSSTTAILTTVGYGAAAAVGGALTAGSLAGLSTWALGAYQIRKMNQKKDQEFKKIWRSAEENRVNRARTMHRISRSIQNKWEQYKVDQVSKDFEKHGFPLTSENIETLKKMGREEGKKRFDDFQKEIKYRRATAKKKTRFSIDRFFPPGKNNSGGSSRTV